MSVDRIQKSLQTSSQAGLAKYQDDLDKSQRGEGVKKYLQDARGHTILRALSDVAKRHGVQPAAVAIAWLIANEQVTAPIASATKPVHLKAFEQATAIQLSAEDLDQSSVEEPERATISLASRKPSKLTAR